MYDSQPMPHKNSTLIVGLVEQLKYTPKEQVEPYLPANIAARRILETKAFIE